MSEIGKMAVDQDVDWYANAAFAVRSGTLLLSWSIHEVRESNSFRDVLLS